MRARPARTAAVLVILGSLPVAVSCGPAQSTQPAAPSPTSIVRLYGADANMSNSFGDMFKDRPGALSGMKGTTPLTQLSGVFKAELLQIDPDLSHFTYTGQAYDAVAVAAIAAEYARTTDPATIAKHIIGVTTGGATCETVAECLSLARQGTDLQYRGISMSHSGFTDAGEPSSATYAAVSFSRDNHIDDSRTEYVGVGDGRAQSSTPSPAPAKGTRSLAPLRIGGLLPHTGRLASFGAPLAAAIRLAINEINAAGGVLSANVSWIDGDDGTSAEKAAATIDHLIAQSVQVVIGAGASSVTEAIIPKIVAARRVLISPTSTSDELATADDAGWFFRTAPPDSLQAKALADVIMRDGPGKVAIVAIGESYGSGLSERVHSNLLLAGLKAERIRRVTYPAKDSYDSAIDTAEIFSPIADGIRSFAPDAILIVGSDESSYLVRSLLSQ